MSFLHAFLAILFPDTCIGCKTSGIILCEACIHKVDRGKIITHTGITALFPFRNPVIQKALWTLKYRHKKRIASVFAPYLYEELVVEISEDTVWRPGSTPKWLLIPIPTSNTRTRGYNQAAEIARAVLKHDSQSLFKYQDSLLVKSRETKSQVSMKNRAERIANIRDSFSVQNKTAIAGRLCIVVDDVTTTGATLSEARRVLMEAGALRVVLVAVAA